MFDGFVSRFGDVHRDNGVRIRKCDMNIYRAEHSVRDALVFVQCLTMNRVAVVDRVAANETIVRTYNLSDGHHPGSDLRVVVCAPDDPALLAYSRVTSSEIQSVGMSVRRREKSVVLEAVPHGYALMQVHGDSFVCLQTDAEASKQITLQTLVTRTPPVPIEANIDIAIVRAIGPFRER